MGDIKRVEWTGAALGIAILRIAEPTQRGLPAAPAHIGTYALRGSPRRAAHIAGYALPEIGLKLELEEQNAGSVAANRACFRLVRLTLCAARINS